MPDTTPSNRKIISLAALSEFKTQYDSYVAGLINGLIPYTGADKSVDLGNLGGSGHTFKALGVEISNPSSGVYMLQNTNNGSFIVSGGSTGDLYLVSGGITYYLPGAAGAVSAQTLATLGDISAVYRFMGSKTVAQINAGASQGISFVDGNTYNVTDSGELNDGPKDANGTRQKVKVVAGDNVSWATGTYNGAEYGYWDKLAGTVDLSSYYTSTQVDTLLSQYVPLSGTEATPMTGVLRVKAGAANAPSIDTDANSNFYLKTTGTGGITIDGSNFLSLISGGNILLKSNGSTYGVTLSTSSITDSNKAINLPNESGTLVTGEYASTGEVQALFN